MITLHFKTDKKKRKEWKEKLLKDYYERNN